MEPGIVQSHPPNAVVREVTNIVDSAIIGSPGSCEIEWLRYSTVRILLGSSYLARQQKRNEKKKRR